MSHPTQAPPVTPSPRARLVRTAWYGLVAILALVLAAVLFGESSKIRGADAIYPLVVLVVFTVIAVASLALEVRAGGRVDGNDDLTAEDDLEGRRGAGIAWPRIGGAVAAIIVSAVVLLLLGYVPFVAFLTIALVRVLGLQSPARTALFAGVTTVATYVIFVVALNSPMPEGILTGW